MRAIEYVLFVVSFVVAGLVVLALLWSGPQPYVDMARDNGVSEIAFAVPTTGGVAHYTPTAAAFGPHAAWSQYVTGGTDRPPAFDQPFFTDDEYAHMADVRRVFDGAKFLVPLALVVIIVRLQRSRARSVRDMWSLVRNGALIAAAAVAVIGVIATFAFDPLFLLFHEVFFPQGNFLFPPSSNLIRLYPDWYWQGISLRVGISFIVIALAVGAFAHLRLRRVLT